MFDQTLGQDAPSCLEQDWEEVSLGRFICSTRLEIFASGEHTVSSRV